MNGKQESRNSMYLTVRDFLIKNASITGTLPNFSPLFTQFCLNITQIKTISEQQQINKSGISENKDKLRAELVASAYDISKKTEVYALMNNNTILAKEIHFSESELEKAADTKLRDKAVLVHEKATGNLGELASYGVTSTSLDTLKNLVDQFDAAIPSTRIGITETKAATDQLVTLFTSNDEIIAKLDLLVELVRRSQPVFYSSYKDNRKIIETGAGSLMLTALVTDSQTGEGIKGAKATFVLQNGSSKAEPALVKTMADKGIFKIKTMTDGIYTVTVEKIGYKSATVTVNVASGDLAEMEVALEKN